MKENLKDIHRSTGRVDTGEKRDVILQYHAQPGDVKGVYPPCHTYPILQGLAHVLPVHFRFCPHMLGNAPGVHLSNGLSPCLDVILFRISRFGTILNAARLRLSAFGAQCSV